MISMPPGTMPSAMIAATQARRIRHGVETDQHGARVTGVLADDPHGHFHHHAQQSLGAGDDAHEIVARPRPEPCRPG